MKKLMKICAALLLVVTMTMTLSACGGGDDNNEPEWIEICSVLYAGSIDNSIYIYDLSFSQNNIWDEVFDSEGNIKISSSKILTGIFSSYVYGFIPVNANVNNTKDNQPTLIVGEDYYYLTGYIDSSTGLPDRYFGVYKYTYNGYTINYVQVQIIDNQTIKVKTPDGRLKLVAGDYVIEYFV